MRAGAAAGRLSPAAAGRLLQPQGAFPLHFGSGSMVRTHRLAATLTFHCMGQRASTAAFDMGLLHGAELAPIRFDCLYCLAHWAGPLAPKPERHH